MSETVIEVNEGEMSLTAQQFNQLLARTNKENPSKKDLNQLKKIFDELPSLAVTIGNMQRSIRENILDAAAGDHAGNREAFKRHLEHFKAELGFDSSSFMERMLIDEVVMRWLRLQVMEEDHRRTTNKSHTLPLGLYVDKRLGLAQHRYLKAMETLAKVRKLMAQTQLKGVKMYTNLMNEKKEK